jgi:hypothetical protein
MIFQKTITYFVAAIWLVNGLICKVLGFVPRHEAIVARILGNDYAPILTVLIGVSEILMACWIVSRFQKKLNAVVQIAIIISMNTLEFMLTPELLLWGKLNFLFALLFSFVIYYNEFRLTTSK